MILYSRRFFFLFFYLLFRVVCTLGQDAHYSQFYANPLTLNPAFAGTASCPRFSIIFRDQYPLIPRNFITFSGSYDQHINELHGGLGLLASADLAGGGIMQTYQVSAIYNFRVQVSRQLNWQFALQAGYCHTSLNWNKLQFATELINPDALPDLPKEFSNLLSKSQFDLSFGTVGYTPFLYFGIAVHHLLPMQTSFFRSLEKTVKKWEPKWTAHIGGKITVIQKVKTDSSIGDLFIFPNIVFISQGNFHYLHEGVYFNIYPFTIGAWLRHNFKGCDAFIISCGIEYKLFRVGYSYDFNLTKLVGTGGAHEVSLQFVIPCNKDSKGKAAQKRGSRYSLLDCPKF